MNTIYKVLGTAFCLTALSGVANAQTAKDTTYNRQILLEREYTPTLQDASKINTMPVITQPEVKSSGLVFETGQPRFTLTKYPLGDTGAGDINSAIDFSKKRGYLGLSAGTYSNVEGNLGYRIVDQTQDVFDIFARHSSMNGTINFVDKLPLEKSKAKYQDNLIKAAYSHKADALKFFIDGSFFNMGYNYYGNSFIHALVGDNLKNQNVNIFNLRTGIESVKVGEFNYSAKIDYKNFSTKFGPIYDDGGLSGNIFDLNLGVSTPLSYDKKIGLDFGFLTQSYGTVKFSIDKKNDFHSLTNLKASPYFNIDGGNFKVSLGANVNYVLDAKDKFVISPNIKASVDVAENTSLFANALGGVNENTFVDILFENRYVDPIRRVAYSKTLYDLSIGLKSGIVSGFEFSVFGGYKHTTDDHLYLVTATPSLRNVGKPIYANVSTGHFGGLIKTNLIPYVDLSAKLVSYFYSVDMKDDLYTIEKAWNRPTFTAELDALVKPIEKLSFNANFLLASGRKTTIDGLSEIKMKNIQELNLRGDYELFDWLSVNVQTRNLLNAKYDVWNGYTQEGFSVLGGVNLKF